MAIVLTNSTLQTSLNEGARPRPAKLAKLQPMPPITYHLEASFVCYSVVSRRISQEGFPEMGRGQRPHWYYTSRDTTNTNTDTVECIDRYMFKLFVHSPFGNECMYVCVFVCVRACVHACVCVCQSFTLILNYFP